MRSHDCVLDGNPTATAARPEPCEAGLVALPVLIGVAAEALRLGLEALVRSTPGMALGAPARSFDELVQLCGVVPDCVALIDLAFVPEGAGNALRELRATANRARVVFICDALQPHVVRDAIANGAAGLVAKTADAREIRASLIAASQGRRYLPLSIAGNLAESLTLQVLTAREMEVLLLLSRGECNKTIARELTVSVGTVKAHMRAILGKLDSRSRTDAVLKAHRIGLIDIRQRAPQA